MTERRDYCRISSDLLLRYRKVLAQEGCAESSEANLSIEHTGWLQEMSEARQKRNRLLSGIRAESPDIAGYLSLLEADLDSLSKALFLSRMSFDEKTDASTELSAGGVAFSCRERLEPGQILDLELVMLPAFALISARAVALRCELSPWRNPALPHRIAVVFQDLKQHQRDQIAKYVLRKQIQTRLDCSADK